MSRFNKYNVAPVEQRTVEGIVFASKLEANRYAQLKLLWSAGKIENLRLQPEFELQKKFNYRGKNIPAIKYVADFEYIENGKRIIEEVKGIETAVFKLKMRMFKYKYPELEVKILYKRDI